MSKGRGGGVVSQQTQANVDLLLAQSRRRWVNNKSSLVQSLVFAGSGDGFRNWQTGGGGRRHPEKFKSQTSNGAF